MKLCAFVFLILVTSSAWSRKVIPPTPPKCDPSPLCSQLDDLSYECSETYNQVTCEKFIDSLEKLLAKNECNYPTLFDCDKRSGAMRIDLHFDRLAELPFQKALKLFTSTLARTAMDGVTAESYKKRSLQDEKKLGKTLHPVNLRPECMSYEEVDWKPNKENIKEIKIGNYSVVALGDVKATITDTKSNKKCYPKLGIVSDSSNKPVKKIKGHDILWFETYSGATTYHSLVDMKTCEKIWEVEIVLDETLTNPIALNNINIVSKSSYKSCAECWNEDKERCLRLPVTMSLQNRDLPKGKD